MRLTGLPDADLNGRLVNVLETTPDRRWAVMLADGRRLSVLRENLEPPVPQENAREERLGSMPDMRLTGLVRRADLNGRLVALLDFTNGRWDVVLR